MSKRTAISLFIGLMAWSSMGPQAAHASPAAASSENVTPEIRALLFEQIGAVASGPTAAHAAPGDDTWQKNLSPDVTTTFDTEGLRLAGETLDGEVWNFGLQLQAYGRAGAMAPATPGALRSTEHRSELQRGPALREWVSRAGKTLTQGFVMAQPPYVDPDGNGPAPAEAGSGDLLFDLHITGTLEATLSTHGRSLELRQDSRRFGYRNLTAVDATGRRLPARAELAGHRLRLRVDDSNAVLPLFLTADVNEIKKLIQPSAGIGENAGWAVALDGDTAVVGARFADVPFFADAGKVYIFQRDQGGADQWGLVKELVASDFFTGSNFGASVDIEGDRIIVGSSHADDFFADNSGRVYVFERNHNGLDNWGEVKRISNPTFQAGDLFGWSVAIEGSTLVVGAFGADQPFIVSAGEAYVFSKDTGGFNNWGLIQTLKAPDAANLDFFGHDVAIDGDTLVVGANHRDVGPILDAGAAYIFDRNTGGPDFWGLIATVTANDGGIQDRFGDSVALSGDTLVVGADFDDGSGIDSGSAYVFERNLGGPNFWGRSAKLVASDQTEADYFGWAVAIEGDTILVGSHFDDSPLVKAGSAYLFERDQGGVGTWGEVGKFTADVMTAGDDFGIAVDLSGETMLIGADLDDDVLPGAGAAYIFERAAAANLVITMNDGTNLVPAGGPLTYNVMVQNLGPDASTDVQVDHLLPAGVSNPTSLGCTEDGAWTGTCSLGSIASGVTVQYTVTVDIDAGTTGTISHTATVAAATGDPSPLDNSVTLTTLVGGGGGGSADLLILKQDSADPVIPGGAPLTYTIEVLNNGPDEAVDVIVVETLPLGVLAPITSGCNADPLSIPVCELGNILPGTSKSYTVTVLVDPQASGTLINIATVSSLTDDPVSNNNTAAESTALGQGNADLLVIMDDTPDPVAAGDLLTYTVEVLNNGPDPAPLTQVVLDLPSSVSTPVSTGCDEDPSGDTNCSLGEIAPGSSKSFTVTVQTDVSVLDTLVANATVSSAANDVIPLNNMTTEATTVEAVGEADLFVLQTDSLDPADAGMPLMYTVIVGNNGPVAAHNVLLTTVMDDFAIIPVTTGCAAGSGGVPTCDLGTIEANGLKVVTILVDIRADADGTLVNQVTVSSANDDSDMSNNSATETTTVIGTPGMADLLVLVDDTPDPATPGSPLNYTVTVINLGPHQAQDVSVASTLPSALANVLSAGCSEDPSGAGSCSLGDLNVNQSVSMSLSGDLDLTAVGPLSFSATVTSETEDPQAANNVVVEATAVEAVPLADLSISVVDDQDPVAPGGTIVYTISVENLGPDDATAVEVSNAMLGDASTVSTGCSEDPTGLPTCSLGTVPSGQTVTFSLEATIPGNTLEDANILEVNVTSEVADTNSANDSASQTTTIDGEPPTVENLHSVGDTGDDSLSECEEARVPIDTLLVTFSDPMNDPAGDTDASDVTNPMVYQLVATGPDHKLSTQQCSGLVDDDVLVPITAVSYDDASRTASLSFGGALEDGPYRLLVCGSDLTGSAGTLLDGDDDDIPGGDWQRYFRIETENLFSIGHFDCNLDGWTEQATSDNEITFSAFDVDSALESGAAVIYQFGSTPVFSLAQCVEIPGKGNFTMSGSLWLRDLGAGDSLEVNQVCEYFTQPNCLGAVAGSSMNSEVFTATTATWGPLQSWSVETGGDTVSAICSVDMRLLNGGSELTVLIDDLFLSDRAFSDTFESGDTSGWSNAVGN